MNHALAMESIRGEYGAASLLGALLSLALCPAAFGAVPSDLGGGHTIFSGTTTNIKGGPEQEILDNIVVWGKIPIPGPNQVVTVTVSGQGEPTIVRNVPADPVTGRYRLKFKLGGCCAYVAQARHGTDASVPVAFEAHGPSRLTPGRKTLLFNRLLQKNGYHMGDVTDYVDESTQLGIIALRKVNELPISDSYAPKLFTLLLSGRAGFQPVHQEDGRHVEVDLSRQVLALVEDGKATDVVHVSTGAFGTPTGDYHFYEKGPGYNAKGMYYSIYYSGNYATHGYSSVPYYPASHGCVRNPEAYSVFIYNWISLGDPMYIYA
jgi:hypothetical protein